MLIIFSEGKTADNVVNDVELDFDDGVLLKVTLETQVYEVTLPANGKVYSASEIQSISVNNPEMMGAIKISVKGLNSDQLQESFPSATIISLQELPTYSEGVFSDNYEIFLTSEFFMVNSSVNINDFVDGFLDSGASINYSFPLNSFAGWNNTYRFNLPSELTYKVTNGNVKQNSISWLVKTMGQSNIKQAEMTLNYKTPTSTFSNKNAINISFIINCSHPKQPILSIEYLAKRIDVNASEILPDFISNVGALPADTIRLCILNDFLKWDTIRNNTLLPIQKQVSLLLKNSSFNQSIVTEFYWKNETTTESKEPYNITSMDSKPPITGIFKDEKIHFTLCNISSRAVFGLINAGATLPITQTDVNFGENFNQMPYPSNGTIILPNNVLFNNKKTIKWNQEKEINGTFKSNKAPSYSTQQINTSFIIDIESTDLNLLSVFTGKTELTMGMFLQETQERNVSTLPAEFSLPSKIDLQYFNADAFRVCVEEKVFSTEQINAFLSNTATGFKTRTQSLFPKIKGEARAKKALFDDSLQWDKNITTMQSDKPIIVSSSMHTAYPLSFHFSIIPPTFNVVPQNLTFESIPNQNVTYQIIFPKGISIDYNDSLNRAVHGINADGRSFLEVSFNASEENLINTVMLYVYPTRLFILSLFIPCFVSIFITFLLLLVVIIIRNKRKRIQHTTQDQYPQYDEEEYYIPPPPSKKKK